MTKAAPDPKRARSIRLRAGLRRRLAAEGLVIPKRMTILYREATVGTDYAEIRHDPGPTEEMTVIDTVLEPITEEGEPSDAFLEAAVRHAGLLRRIDMRCEALTKAAYDLRHPPRHAQEAHPLLVLVHRLIERNAAGIHGDLVVRSGLLTTSDLKVTTPGTRFHLSSVKTTSIKLLGPWPQTLIGATGTRLANLIEMPRSGHDLLDEQIAKLIIAEATIKDGDLILLLEPVPVVEMAPTPAFQDGRWKDLDPRPAL